MSKVCLNALEKRKISRSCRESDPICSVMQQQTLLIHRRIFSAPLCLLRRSLSLLWKSSRNVVLDSTVNYVPIYRLASSHRCSTSSTHSNCRRWTQRPELNAAAHKHLVPPSHTGSLWPWPKEKKFQRPFSFYGRSERISWHNQPPVWLIKFHHGREA